MIHEDTGKSRLGQVLLTNYLLTRMGLGVFSSHLYRLNFNFIIINTNFNVHICNYLKKQPLAPV